MYELKNQLSLKLYFDDKEFPFQYANAVDFIHMSCSTKLGVPMLHMVLYDNMDFFPNSGTLGDATKIALTVGTSEASDTYRFRLNSFNRLSSPGGNRYELDAYMDVPAYWSATTKQPFHGTSNDALQNLASTCSLKYSGTPTSDSQVWYSGNHQNHEWARMLAERGYKSTNSCMQLGLDLSATLVYSNVMEKSEPIARFSVGDPKPGYYLASDFLPASTAGSANHFSGYKESAVAQSVFTQGQQTLSDVSVFVPASTKLLVNDSVVSSVARGRVYFTAVDSGNVHSFYEKALYQNRRLTGLFNMRMELVTPMHTNLKLLDTLEVVVDSKNKKQEAFSGNYRVASRVVYIHDMNYYEKLELFSPTIGFNKS
jgi:hypothetical protein